MRHGTLVAGISLKPYEQTEATALWDSVLLGGVLLLVVGFASWWLLASALRPVGRMTEQAELWSERELTAFQPRSATGRAHATRRDT